MSSITQSLRRKRCFGTLCPAATPIYRMKLIPNGLVKGGYNTYFAFFHFEYARSVYPPVLSPKRVTAVEYDIRLNVLIYMFPLFWHIQKLVL